MKDLFYLSWKASYAFYKILVGFPITSNNFSQHRDDLEAIEIIQTVKRKF